MSTASSNNGLPIDHLAWLWLIIGAALIAFASLQPSLPLATRLAPYSSCASCGRAAPS